MTLPQSPYPSISISINVSGVQLSFDERERAKNSTRDAITRLIRDFAIPVTFELVLMVSDKENDADPARIDLEINNQVCLIPHFLNALDNISSKALTFRFVELIHRNRQLLVDPSLAQFIKQQYGKTFDFLSPDQWYRFIQTMLKYGFDLDRCADFIQPPDTEGWDHRHCFNALIDTTAATTIQVTLNKVYDELNNQTKGEKLEEMAALMQDGLFYELGLVFPLIQWKTNHDLDEHEFQVQIQDINYPVVTGLKPGRFLVNETVDRLALLNVAAEKTRNPANNRPCSIISEADVTVCEQAGLTTWDPLGYMILFLSRQLRDRAGGFLTPDVLENDLESLRLAFPVLVDSMLNQYDKFDLIWILRDLLEEEIAVRDLRNILEHLLAINGASSVDVNQFIVFFPAGTHLVVSPREKDILDSADYANYIRAAAFRRYISHKYSRGQSTLLAYILDPSIEAMMDAFADGRLTEEECRTIRTAVRNEVGNISAVDQMPVILASYYARRPFRKLIEGEFPDLHVLSYQELSPEMNIQPVARITLN